MTEDTGEQLYHPTPVRSSDDHPVVSSCTRTRPLRSGFKPPERDGDNGILRAAQRRATETETRTRVLQNAAAAFGISDSIDDVASALAQIAREDVGAETAAVFLNNRQAHLLAGAVPFDPESFHVVPPGGWISSESRTWSRSIATTDPDVVAALDSAHLESLLIAPLLRGREVVGSLACFFSREQAADPHTVDLVSALCRQAAQVLARLKLQAELAALALYDPLTGLANRILLRTHISSSVQTVGSDLESLALIFIDLDSFKSINDKFGHSAGDAVLATVASRITGSVRAGDLVCRFGGDEFIVVCQHTTQVEALAVAERIRTEIKHPSHGDGWTTSLTASVGVTVHPPPGHQQHPDRNGPASHRGPSHVPIQQPGQRPGQPYHSPVNSGTEIRLVTPVAAECASDLGTS